MKLKPTLGEIYASMEDNIILVDAMIEAESDTDIIMYNELRLLKENLTQAMLKARQLADIKLQQSRDAAIKLKGKR
jgi:hypothetical protein